MAVFQGIGSSRLVLKWMTAHHVQTPNMPRGHICSWCALTGAICLYESAVYGIKHTVITWNTVCQYMCTQIYSSSYNAKLLWTYIWLTEDLGAIIEFLFFEFVSISPFLQQRSFSISLSYLMLNSLALYCRRGRVLHAAGSAS